MRQKIYVGENAHGKGLFLAVPVLGGEHILTQRGALVHDPSDLVGCVDHLTQIDTDLFLSTSGEIDDYLNHSCDPNAYQLMHSTYALVIALRDIPAGEEVVFDYGLAMTPESLVMFPALRFQCKCGSSICRGGVGAATEIPKARREYYRSLGIVPNYILPYL